MAILYPPPPSRLSRPNRSGDSWHPSSVTFVKAFGHGASMLEAYVVSPEMRCSSLESRRIRAWSSRRSNPDNTWHTMRTPALMLSLCREARGGGN